MESIDGISYQDRYWTSDDGLRHYLRDYAGASGPTRLPVVCLHGLTRSSRDFADVAPFVAQTGRRVIVADIRGRGLSGYDPNPMNYIPSVYANDVIGLLQALGIAHAVFVGTSLGGMITMTAAAIPGNQVAAAILNDVGPEVDPAGLARIVKSTANPKAVRDWNDAVNYVRAQSGVAFPKYSDEEWLRVAHRAFREDGSGRPVLDYDEAIAVPIKAGKLVTPPETVWDLFRRLASSHPTLLIRGALSDILSVDVAARMRRAAPSLKYAQIDDVGHAPALTEPQAREAILEFLGGVP